MKKRVVEYDILRVALTLLVVLGHAARTAELTPLGGVDFMAAPQVAALYGPLTAAMQALATWIYRFHMPLFIALSGAVYQLAAARGFDKLCLGKARRLLLPFLAGGLLFMIPVKVAAGFYSLSSLREVIFAFLLGTESGHLWFLVALFWCFLLFWPIRVFIAEKSPLAGLFVALLAGQLLQLLPFGDFEFTRGAASLGWFAAGYAFASLRGGITRLVVEKKGTAWLCLAALAALAALNTWLAMLPGAFNTIIMGLLLYLAAALWAQRPKAGQGRGFKLLLSYSLFIYIFHDPLEYLILRVAFTTSLLLTPVGVVAYYLARTVGVVVISIIIGWVLRKLYALAAPRLKGLLPKAGV